MTGRRQPAGLEAQPRGRHGYRDRTQVSGPQRCLQGAGDGAFLTVKGPAAGATRAEFEYAIPPDDARALLGLCEPPLIEKTRHVVPHRGLVREVDEFHGANQGLVVAECELRSEDQAVDKPDWVGQEVTGDVWYSNSSLVATPFTSW